MDNFIIEMDAYDLTDLTTFLARGLPKIRHMEDTLLIHLNDILDLFGYRGY